MSESFESDLEPGPFRNRDGPLGGVRPVRSEAYVLCSRSPRYSSRLRIALSTVFHP